MAVHTVIMEFGKGGVVMSIQTDTAADVVLKELIEQNHDYGNNFVFTVIESFFNRDGNALYILERENYWKKVFSTRSFGNNKN